MLGLGVPGGCEVPPRTQHPLYLPQGSHLHPEFLPQNSMKGRCPPGTPSHRGPRTEPWLWLQGPGMTCRQRGAGGRDLESGLVEEGI